MLNDRPTHTTLPITDRERAKAFYRDKLGLEPTAESPAAVSYFYPDLRFILFESQGQPSGNHTQMGWDVADLETTVAELKNKGVAFEQYDFPGFDKATSIATHDDVKSAWFKDSEGNLLGLVQLPS